jgi:hypothetical protein
MVKPLLLVDVDGVISLFGFDRHLPPPGRYLLVEGLPHFISDVAGDHLRDLVAHYDLAWCTGWEEKANDHLPLALGLPGPLPHLSLADGATPRGKAAAIDHYAGRARPVAWVDDVHDEACSRWAARRPGPTLLVTTDPAVGLTAGHVEELRAWSRGLR